MDQKPHVINYKVITNSKFILFKVENRPLGTVFFIFIRLFIRFKLLWRTKYADVRSKRIPHQNLLVIFHNVIFCVERKLHLIAYKVYRKFNI